jgi:hypothetical protein
LQTSLLEIVELPNGDIVLRRANGEGEPLVNIRFSKESREYLPNGRIEVAKAMIQAGIQTAAELAGGEAHFDFIGGDDDQSRLLH